MAVVRKPKHFVDKSIWPELSEKLGDFIEENLWGGTGEKGAEMFKRKYGEDWEEKREASRKSWRTLAGLLPAKDAKMFEMAVYAAPVFGGLVNLYRGTQAGLRISQLAQLSKRAQKLIKKNPGKLKEILEEELRFMGGGEFGLGSDAPKPLWAALGESKAASYPYGKAGLAERDLYKITMEEDVLRRVPGFGRFDKSLPYESYNVYQPSYSAYHGMEVPERALRLEAVWPKGLKVKDVEKFGRWENIKFKGGQNPHEYYQDTGQFLAPKLGDAAYNDLLPLVRKLYR
jgi:hypothetical protein